MSNDYVLAYDLEKKVQRGHQQLFPVDIIYKWQLQLHTSQMYQIRLV